MLTKLFIALMVLLLLSWVVPVFTSTQPQARQVPVEQISRVQVVKTQMISQADQFDAQVPVQLLVDGEVEIVDTSLMSADSSSHFVVYQLSIMERFHVTDQDLLVDEVIIDAEFVYLLDEADSFKLVAHSPPIARTADIEEKLAETTTKFRHDSVMTPMAMISGFTPLCT